MRMYSRSRSGGKAIKMNLGQVYRAIAAIVAYAVIDLVWHLLPFVTTMYESLRDASGLGNDWSFGKPMETWGGIEFVALLLFFILIGIANWRLAIEPAMKASSLNKAMVNSFILGLGAYATYSVPSFVAIAMWPVPLVFIDIIIGGFLSLATSTIVTAIALKLRDR